MELFIVVIPIAALWSFLSLTLTHSRGTRVVSAVFFIITSSLLGFAFDCLQAWGRAFTGGSVSIHGYTFTAGALSLVYALAIDWAKQRNKEEQSESLRP